MIVEQSLHNIFDEPDRYVNLAEVAHWQILFNSTLAITLFFVWIKVWPIADISVHSRNCAELTLPGVFNTAETVLPLLLVGFATVLFQQQLQRCFDTDILLLSDRKGIQFVQCTNL